MLENCTRSNPVSTNFGLQINTSRLSARFQSRLLVALDYASTQDRCSQPTGFQRAWIRSWISRVPVWRTYTSTLRPDVFQFCKSLTTNSPWATMSCRDYKQAVSKNGTLRTVLASFSTWSIKTTSSRKQSWASPGSIAGSIEGSDWIWMHLPEGAIHECTGSSELIHIQHNPSPL